MLFQGKYRIVANCSQIVIICQKSNQNLTTKNAPNESYCVQQLFVVLISLHYYISHDGNLTLNCTLNECRQFSSCLLFHPSADGAETIHMCQNFEICTFSPVIATVVVHF